MALARPCKVSLLLPMVMLLTAPEPTWNWKIPCVIRLLAESNPCDAISWAWAKLLTLKLYTPGFAPLDAEAVARFELLDAAVRPSKTLLLVPDRLLTADCKAVRSAWMVW